MGQKDTNYDKLDLLLSEGALTENVENLWAVGVLPAYSLDLFPI